MSSPFLSQPASFVGLLFLDVFATLWRAYKNSFAHLPICIKQLETEAETGLIPLKLNIPEYIKMVNVIRSKLLYFYSKN
jgi:hypothetical protein